jgi:hypothetical protein
MTDNFREQAPRAGRKRNLGYVYEEVPNNEVNPGISLNDLGARWGTDPGKLEKKGQVTRKGTWARLIPGGIEPAQDEQEVQPESLDQPVRTGDDRPDLD